MGIRFRKSISFGKFFRLNLSKSGVSLGVGPRGLNVNIGPRGVRQTIGLPGTGIYYQESHQWPKSRVVDPTGTATSPEVRNSELGWKIIGGVLAVIVLIAYFGRGSPTTDSKQPATVSKPAASPPPVTPSEPDRPLSRDEVRELQALLNKKGFKAGTPDGVIGAKTRAAAQAFAGKHQIKDTQTDPTLRVLIAARGH
jgi:hypothetical protein